MEKIPYSKFNCIGALLEAAEKNGVSVELVDKDRGLKIFRKQGKSVFVKFHVPDLNSYVSCTISDNKALAKLILSKHNIPNPKGWISKNLRNILHLVDQGIIKFPVVAKPIDGSQGHAVTVGIKDKECLVGAIKEVHKYNRRMKGKPNSFLIEEYLSGCDYRILVLDGKVLTSLRREPAYVNGDGLHTIRELIDEYNDQPGVGKAQPLCPIVRDFEFRRNLIEKKLTEGSIILKGDKVYLRQNANVSTGGRSFECDDEVNPEYKKLAVKIAAIFQLRFCAIDLIAADIKKFEKFGIIEISHMPGFDIHEVPYRGKPFHVAESLMKAMFNPCLQSLQISAGGDKCGKIKKETPYETP